MTSLNVQKRVYNKIENDSHGPAVDKRFDRVGSVWVRSPRTHFLDIFHYGQYPIFTGICSLLSISAIIALTRTCKALSTLYQELLPQQWNVDLLLGRFVQDPLLFRSQLGRYDALVSGSFAVQFFDRVQWTDSDLDIYIKGGVSTDAFGTYLCEAEGYDAGEGPQNDYSFNRIIEVRSYTKWSDTDSVELKVQIIRTIDIPIIAILGGFYSSVVVNVISWNKAYALFASPTYLDHKGYLLQRLDEHRASLLVKYGRRGWKFQDIMWPEDQHRNDPFREVRRVGDKFTWTLPFNTKGIERPETPDSVLEYAVFSVSKTHPDGEGESTRYSISIKEFNACTLKYKHTFARFKKNYQSWESFLCERMDRLTLIELHKLDPVDRSDIWQSCIERPVCLYLRNRRWPVKPATWVYSDDEIPKWYKYWEEVITKKTGFRGKDFFDYPASPETSQWYPITQALEEIEYSAGSE